MTDITQRLRSFVACEGGDLADIEEAADEIDRLRAALQLIAAPRRPDGTFNRDRNACQRIAKDALGYD